MYEIDAVRGYVLGYYNQGEADRRYRILTREFGVIQAYATSVRKEKSKLKHALQKLNLVEIETIQSRKGYQITGGRLIDGLSRTLDFRQLGVLDRIGQLIGRLSQNPDTDTDLFSIFEQIIGQLQSHSGPTTVNAVELWGVARVLMEFGYFDPEFSPQFSQGVFRKEYLSGESVENICNNQKELERYIKQCVDQTML